MSKYTDLTPAVLIFERARRAQKERIYHERTENY